VTNTYLNPAQPERINDIRANLVPVDPAEPHQLAS